MWLFIAEIILTTAILAVSASIGTLVGVWSGSILIGALIACVLHINLLWGASMLFPTYTAETRRRWE